MNRHMSRKRKFRSAAVQELYDETIGDDPAAQEEFEEELVNIEVAQLIHDMRTKAGLSQRELARKVGTSASAINRLESNDYQGHTIAMVRRIAASLNRRLELRAVQIKKKAYARERSAGTGTGERSPGSGSLDGTGYSQRNATIGSTRAARRAGR